MKMKNIFITKNFIFTKIKSHIYVYTILKKFKKKRFQYIRGVERCRQVVRTRSVDR